MQIILNRYAFNLFAYNGGGMKSWRIYERCSINRVKTLNEAKMINNRQNPPCFIPRVVCCMATLNDKLN